VYFSAFCDAAAAAIDALTLAYTVTLIAVFLAGLWFLASATIARDQDRDTWSADARDTWRTDANRKLRGERRRIR
jgi:hypothetical protein